MGIDKHLTADIRSESGQAEQRLSVGSDIRALRKSRKLTLVELTERLNRSLGWLSQVERGASEPSIQDLRRIAQIFDIPISFFFRHHDVPERERGVVVRASARAQIGTPEAGLVEELLSPDLSGDFEMIKSTFAPGASCDPVAARPTLEGGYVVSGTLELTIGGELFVLSEGDSFQFQNRSHHWHNPEKHPAVIIWIVSPPVY